MMINPYEKYTDKLMSKTPNNSEIQETNYDTKTN